jgi:3-hydroxyisobutyrate dehydrogenase
VSGGVPRAKTGTLAIMAGGDASLIEAVEDMLSAMGKVMRTGPLGSGHAMKALNNYVSAAGLAAACEALLVGARFGLEPRTITDVLNASTGRNNATENKLAQHILGRGFGSGFALDLMVKDVNAARDLARQLGVPAPELDHVSALYERASETLGKGADHTAIFAYLESLGPVSDKKGEAK